MRNYAATTSIIFAYSLVSFVKFSESLITQSASNNLLSSSASSANDGSELNANQLNPSIDKRRLSLAFESTSDNWSQPDTHIAYSLPVRLIELPYSSSSSSPSLSQRFQRVKSERKRSASSRNIHKILEARQSNLNELSSSNSMSGSLTTQPELADSYFLQQQLSAQAPTIKASQSLSPLQQQIPPFTIMRLVPVVAVRIAPNVVGSSSINSEELLPVSNKLVTSFEAPQTLNTNSIVDNHYISQQQQQQQQFAALNQRALANQVFVQQRAALARLLSLLRPSALLSAAISASSGQMQTRTLPMHVPVQVPLSLPLPLPLPLSPSLVQISSNAVENQAQKLQQTLPISTYLVSSSSSTTTEATPIDNTIQSANSQLVQTSVNGLNDKKQATRAGKTMPQSSLAKLLSVCADELLPLGMNIDSVLAKTIINDATNYNETSLKRRANNNNYDKKQTIGAQKSQKFIENESIRNLKQQENDSNINNNYNNNNNNNIIDNSISDNNDNKYNSQAIVRSSLLSTAIMNLTRQAPMLHFTINDTIQIPHVSQSRRTQNFESRKLVNLNLLNHKESNNKQRKNTQIGSKKNKKKKDNSSSSTSSPGYENLRLSKTSFVTSATPMFDDTISANNNEFESAIEYKSEPLSSIIMASSARRSANALQKEKQQQQQQSLEQQEAASSPFFASFGESMQISSSGLQPTIVINDRRRIDKLQEKPEINTQQANKDANNLATNESSEDLALKQSINNNNNTDYYTSLDNNSLAQTNQSSSTLTKSNLQNYDLEFEAEKLGSSLFGGGESFDKVASALQMTKSDLIKLQNSRISLQLPTRLEYS